MSFNRIPGAGSPGLPQTPAPGGGSVAPGGGSSPPPRGPQGLSARPVLTRSQSLPPRQGAPGKQLARMQGSLSSMAQASHEPAEPAAVLPPAGGRNYEYTLSELKALRAGQSGQTEGGSGGSAAKPATQTAGPPRTYDFYMNQLKDLHVEVPPASGQAGQVQGGPPGGGAKPGKPGAELPLNTFFTTEPPSPPSASPVGTKSEDPFNWSGKLFPAGGDTLPPATSGARPQGRLYELPPNPFDMAGDPKPSASASASASAEGPKLSTPAAGLPLDTFFTTDSPSSSVAQGSAKPGSSPASAGGSAKPQDPFDWLGVAPQPSAPSGGRTKPGPSAAELPVNTTLTTDDPQPSPSASGGGKSEKPAVDVSVTIDPSPLSSGAPGGGQPGKVHVEASVDVEPSGPGAGPAAPPNPRPSQLTEMQQLQESQRLNLAQQAQMQQLNIEMQVKTALLSQEMNLASALVSLIKQGGEGVKHAAP